MSQADDHQRYLDAMHGIQSAVLFEIGSGGPKHAGADPKHLRVGVNSALISHGALLSILVDKGIVTLEEFTARVASMAEQDLAGYQDKYPGMSFR